MYISLCTANSRSHQSPKHSYSAAACASLSNSLPGLARLDNPSSAFLCPASACHCLAPTLGCQSSNITNHHRNAITKTFPTTLDNSSTIHLSIHLFTPDLQPFSLLLTAVWLKKPFSSNRDILRRKEANAAYDPGPVLTLLLLHASAPCIALHNDFTLCRIPAALDVQSRLRRSFQTCHTHPFPFASSISFLGLQLSPWPEPCLHSSSTPPPPASTIIPSSKYQVLLHQHLTSLPSHRRPQLLS